MKIVMLGTHRGSEDGFGIKLYEKDREYDIAAHLGHYFVHQGWAKDMESYRTPDDITQELIIHLRKLRGANAA